MTTTTQQLPSNPAIDFANAVLAETDNAREIINMLHDIAQGHRESSTASDRINASKILLDRGLGKCPRHISPTAGPALDADPDPESAESDNHTNHSSDTPQTLSSSEPESPRLVTRLDHSLHNSLGPAPSAEALPTDPTRHSRESGNPLNDSRLESPDPFDPNSIHFSIQQHILDITNNCRTLMTALTDICRTPDDDPKACPEEEPALSQSKGRRITDYHRVRAGRMLLDRILGIDPNAALDAAGGLDLAGNCPQCSYVLSSTCPEHSRTVEDDAQEQTAPDPKWLEALAKIQQMKDDGILTPDPNAPEIDHDYYMKGTEEEIRPYADEVVAKYRADLELRLERRKNWPEIEERRRKKLAELYPSHSEDGEQTDT